MRKTTRTMFVSVMAAIVFLAASQSILRAQTPLGTAFTYQGRLTDAGNPANGQYDLEFRLFDAAAGGNPVGDPVFAEDREVVNGLFTVQLDFGNAAFNGQARWLQVGVRPGASSDAYTPLSPRQAITPTPYALQTRGIFVGDAGNVGIGTADPQKMLHVFGQDVDGVGIEVPDGPDNRAMLEFTAGLRPATFDHGACIQLTSPSLPNKPNALQLVNHLAGPILLYGSHVGIGTPDPGSSLTVAGTVESTSGGFKFPDGSVQSTAAGSGLWMPMGSDIFYTAGSVGIGTTTPSVGGGDTVAIKTAELTSPRAAIGCAASPATGKIYCFGGFDGSDLGGIFEYDPSTDRLVRQNATMSPARHGSGWAADPSTGKIYCFGGWSTNGYFSQIMVYDPIADTFLDTGADLPAPTGGLTCAYSSITGKMYCFGGYKAGGPYLGQILVYDPANPTQPPQNTGAVLPSPRANLTCATDLSSGKIYVFGGEDGDESFDDILEYEPGQPGQDPVRVAGLPSRRAWCPCTFSPSAAKLYCFGGWDGVSQFDDIVEYDPANAVVTMRAKLPSERWGMGAAADLVTGKCYCFGGRIDPTTSFFSQILEYTPPVQTLLQVGNPGDGTGAIANTWSVFSSREFKRDIAPLGVAEYGDILSKLKATDAVRFSYAHDPQQTRHLGVIAENAPAEILSPGGKGVSLADYSTFLMAAIKAQQVLIEEKERQIADLQAQMAETQKRLADLEAIAGKLEPRQRGGGR